jgi:hypothetical protein
VFSHLDVLYRAPVGSSVELARTLREGSAELVHVERSLAKAAKSAGNKPIDWGPVPFAQLLVGKSGPYGGALATPASVAFFLAAHLLEGPRKDIAVRALDLMYAPIDPTPNLSYSRGCRICEGPLCDRTGAGYFGAALIKILGDLELLKLADTISVSNELGLGVILFVDDDSCSMSQFATTDLAKRVKQGGRYSLLNLYGPMLVPIVETMIGDAEAAA